LNGEKVSRCPSGVVVVVVEEVEAVEAVVVVEEVEAVDGADVVLWPGATEMGVLSVALAPPGCPVGGAELPQAANVTASARAAAVSTGRRRVRFRCTVRHAGTAATPSGPD
jgi:hypothetical protein